MLLLCIASTSVKHSPKRDQGLALSASGPDMGKKEELLEGNY